MNANEYFKAYFLACKIMAQIYYAGSMYVEGFH